MKSIMTGIVGAFLVGVAWGQEGDGSLEKRFLSEFPLALQAWEKRMAVAEGKVRCVTDEMATGTAKHSDVTYSFKCKLPEMAVITSVADVKGRALYRAMGFNTEYSFSLKKAEDRNDYSVEALHHGPDRTAAYRRLGPLLEAPYLIRPSSMKMFSSPRFSVRSVRPVVRGDKNLLEIAFDLPADPQIRPRKGAIDIGGYEGSFVVSPDEQWVIYGYECQPKKGILRRFRGSISYRASSDGSPVPKTVLAQTLSMPENNVIRTDSYDFQDFGFSDRVKEKDFTLSAFGIPESVSQRPQRALSGGAAFWLFGLALLALAAAIAFKAASSRTSKASEGLDGGGVKNGDATPRQ